MPDGENQEPVVDAGNGQNGETTGGENQGTGGSDETPTEETFPSFRKAYKYKGGFDKFVYDTLKKLTEELDK